MLDALILLAVFTLIAGVIWRSELNTQIKRQDSENRTAVECFFSITDVMTTPQFSEGETTVYFEDGSAAKLIKTVETVIVSEDDVSEDGYVPKTATAETMTLRFNVVSRDSGFYLENGGKVHKGALLLLHTDLYEFTAEITTILE